MINHPGCPNKGQRLHVPDKYKNVKKFSKNGGGYNNNSNTTSEPFPESDEKMKDGEKFVLCRTCNGGKGRWFKESHPKAHKTSEHKRRDQLLATTNPHSLISQVAPKNSSNSDDTTLDSDDEKAFQRVCATTGIPMDVLKAGFKKKNDVSAPSPTTTEVQSAPQVPTTPQKATQPSGTLSFQLNLMDDIDEFTDAFESEDLFNEEGPGVVAAWFQECNLPPPGPATDDDNVSTFSDCDEDFYDCFEDIESGNNTKVEPFQVPHSTWFVLNNFGLEGLFSFTVLVF